jgi:hypothetical protein
MNIKRLASLAALTLATSLGITTAVMPVTAQASTRCSVSYGNSVLTGDFTFSNRNVSVNWVVSAASGSGSKRVRVEAWNNAEWVKAYGTWVAAGTRGTGTVSPTASQVAGGYGFAVLWLTRSEEIGGSLVGLRASREGECRAV